MKKTRTFVCALVALSTLASFAAQAQLSFGIKGGANVSNLNGLNSQNFETNALVGLHLGAFLTANVGRNFALQPELYFSSQGAKLESAGNSENLRANYVNIPVMVRFLTNGGFFVEAGPQIGIKVSEADLEDINGSFKNSDFGGAIGLGFQGMKSPLGFGARYNVGFSKVNDFDTGDLQNADLKNGVFQLSLYLRLFGGGKLKK